MTAPAAGTPDGNKRRPLWEWLLLHRMAIMPFAAWVTVLIVGFRIMAWHAHLLVQDHEHEQFVALKVLQTNHRLADGDIAEAGLWHPFLRATLTKLDDFNGRYVKDCVNAQDPIEIEKTASGPELRTTPATEQRERIEKHVTMVNHVRVVTPVKIVKDVKIEKAIVWIPLRELPAADVARLDVHRQLDVCNLDGNEACGPIPVEAIACTGKTMDAETCSAAIQIRIDQRRRLLLALEATEATPNPASTPAAGTGTKPSDNGRSAAAKPHSSSAVHVMIHRSDVGSKTSTSDPTACPSTT